MFISFTFTSKSYFDTSVIEYEFAAVTGGVKQMMISIIIIMYLILWFFMISSIAFMNYKSYGSSSALVGDACTTVMFNLNGDRRRYSGCIWVPLSYIEPGVGWR